MYAVNFFHVYFYEDTIHLRLQKKRYHISSIYTLYSIYTQPNFLYLLAVNLVAKNTAFNISKRGMVSPL